KNLLDQYAEECRTVQEVLQTHNELLTYLQHPQMNKQQKKKLIQNIFKELQRDIINTIQLLIERRRHNIKSSMIDNLIQIVNDAKGVAEATVYSVRKMSDEEREALAGKMAKRFHKQSVTFHNVVDPSIIGGLKIHIGNTIIDGTISGKLNRLKRN